MRFNEVLHFLADSLFSFVFVVHRLTLLELSYLGTAATSVPSERIFFKAEEIITYAEKVKPSTVDMLVFLSTNQSALDQKFCLTIYEFCPCD